MKGWWRKLVKRFNPPAEVSPFGVWVRFPWQTVLVDPEEYRRCPAWWDGRARAYVVEEEVI